MKNDIEKKLDQVTGKIKETAGKLTDSERLELEGKVERLTAKLSEAASEEGKAIQEKIAEKANDLLDQLDKKLDTAKNKDK